MPSTSDFEKDIRAAIPLLRLDPHSADVMLTRIHRRARRAGDRKAAFWALQLLQMLVGVTGREPERYVKICREVVREDPRRPMSWVFLGTAEQALGKTRAAITAFHRALELAKHDRETAETARRCLEEAGVAPSASRADGKKRPPARVTRRRARSRA